MFLRKCVGRARSLVALLLGISLVAAPVWVIAGPANAAVTVTRELVDVDFTTASQSGSTIVNNATDKTADLTVFGSPTGLGTKSGLTFSNTVMYNTSQYLTGNLGNTSVMSEIVVEFVARFRVGGKAVRQHERSRFVREDGRWFYVDGDEL